MPFSYPKISQNSKLDLKPRILQALYSVPDSLESTFQRIEWCVSLREITTEFSCQNGAKLANGELARVAKEQQPISIGRKLFAANSIELCSQQPV